MRGFAYIGAATVGRAASTAGVSALGSTVAVSGVFSTTASLSFVVGCSATSSSEAATLKTSALLKAAAFKSAEVLSVAASEEEVVETPTNESEAVVENTPDTASVEPKVEAPAVEAARPTVAAPIYAKPRINVTPLAMLENTIKANIFNDESARQWIAAASDTDTVTDVPGLVPTRQLTEVWNPKSTGTRATIEAISSGTLPDAGMKFQIPRVKTVPTVGAPIAEGGAFDDTQVEIEYLDVDVKKSSRYAVVLGGSPI